jgi:hypothetical protein
MDLQNKYQILASEFSKVRGQVTVLKKAVIDEQSKNQQLQVIDFLLLLFIFHFDYFFQGKS